MSIPSSRKELEGAPMGVNMAMASSSDNLSIWADPCKFKCCEENGDNLNSDRASWRNFEGFKEMQSCVDEEEGRGWEANTRVASNKEAERPASNGAMAWPALRNAAPAISSQSTTIPMLRMRNQQHIRFAFRRSKHRHCARIPSQVDGFSSLRRFRV